MKKIEKEWSLIPKSSHFLGDLSLSTLHLFMVKQELII